MKAGEADCISAMHSSSHAISCVAFGVAKFMDHVCFRTSNCKAYESKSGIHNLQLLYLQECHFLAVPGFCSFETFGFFSYMETERDASDITCKE